MNNQCVTTGKSLQRNICSILLSILCVCVFKAEQEYIINFQIRAILEQAFSRLECLNATLNTKNIQYVTTNKSLQRTDTRSHETVNIGWNSMSLLYLLIEKPELQSIGCSSSLSTVAFEHLILFTPLAVLYSRKKYFNLFFQ